MTLTREQWMRFLQSRQERLQQVRFEDFSDRWNKELKEFMNASGSVELHLRENGKIKMVLN